MASGSLSLTSNNQYIVGSLTWSSTPNTAGNYSDVYAELRMWRTNTGYTTNGTGNWGINIDGHGESQNVNVSLSYNSNTFIMSLTYRVYHNADGTKSCFLNVSGGISGTSYTATYLNGGNGVYVTLDTIPRASQPTLDTDPNDAGTPVWIRTHRASTSFTHNLSYAFGNASGTIATGVATDYQWTIPMDLINQIPSSTSGSGTIYCDTYNGSSLVGSTSLSFTVTVPSSITPSFGSVSPSELNTSVSNVVGSGVYVKTLSNIRFTISGMSGAYSSNITRAYVTFNGTSYNASINGGTATFDTGTLGINGTINYSAYVVDSRGRASATQSGTVNVLNYAPPNISSFTAKRCDSAGNDNQLGTYLKIVRNGSATSLVNGSEKNTLACTVQWSIHGNNTWTSMSEMGVTTSSTLSFSTSGITSTKSDFAITNSYDIKITVTDKFNNTISTIIVSTGTVVMSWSKSGVGIGKVWSQGALDVGGDIYVNGILQNRYNTLPSGDGSLAYWHTIPDGTYFATPSTVTGQPSDWGFIEKIGFDGDFNILWFTQTSGKIFRLSGNGSAITGWVQILTGSTSASDTIKGDNGIVFGVSPDRSNQDFNAQSGGAIWRGTNLSNSPTSTSDWFHVVQMAHADSNWDCQIASNFFADNMYFRRKSNGAWQPWRKLLWDGMQYGTIQQAYVDRLHGWTNDNQVYLASGNCRIDCTGGTARFQADASDYISIDSGSFSVYIGGTSRFSVSSTGSKTGGTMDIDGVTYGMSPMDSPRMMIEDFYLDAKVDVNGTTFQLNPIYAKMIQGYGVFTSNGNVEVVSKDATSFTVKGYTGTVDIRVIGNRKDNLDYYYPVMNNVPQY